MTLASALPCPACKRSRDALTWINADACSCRYCLKEFTFVPFPALTKGPAVSMPKAVAVEEDATCFFHFQNQAESVCEGCGRFLCAVCAIPFAGKTLCPPCIASSKQMEKPEVVTRRTLYGGLAMSLAILPLLIWRITVVTSPIALGMAIAGWKKPQSLTRPGRGRLVIAGLIATIEVGAWIVGIIYFLRQPHH